MTVTLNPQQEKSIVLSEERKQLRRKTIGASEASIILGISPYGSTKDLWLEKAGLDTSKDTQRTRLGHYLQYGVALEALNQIGGAIKAEEPFATHVDGWASATPDYIIAQGDDLAILEIKTTWERSWDVVPEHYLMQVNWQCWVHGIDRAYLAALHGGLNVQIYEVTPQLQSVWFVDAVRRCKDWYDRFMVGDETPPEVDAPDENLKAAIRAEAGKSIDLDDETVAQLRRLTELKRSNAPVSEEITALEKVIKEKLASAEVGLYQGKTLVTWKESVSSSFDSARFKTEYPDLAKQFSKQTISRRFLPKEDILKSMTEATSGVN